MTQQSRLNLNSRGGILRQFGQGLNIHFSILIPKYLPSMDFVNIQVVKER